jgi:hypothetical protein
VPAAPPGRGSASARSRRGSRRARQNRLTGQRPASRRRTSRLTLTPHVREWSISRHGIINRHGSGHRHRRRSGHRHRPRQSQRNTIHVREWTAGGSAHVRRRSSVARRPLDARIAAARYQRAGCRVRAQRYGGTAQPGAGNYFDVEPIEDRHNVNSLNRAQIFRNQLVQPNRIAVPKSRLTTD